MHLLGTNCAGQLHYDSPLHPVSPVFLIRRVVPRSERDAHFSDGLIAGLLSERKKADELLREEEIGTKTADWGVGIISVEIRDVAILPGLQDAMSRRTQAEQEKEARIIPGSSEQQIAQTFVDAADIYAKSLVAVQLRAMNLVYEATKSGE